MEEITQLIDSIRISGHYLTVKDGKLLFTAAPGTSSEAKAEVLTRLRACKGPLIAYLEAPKGPQGEDAYEVSPGIYIYSPRTDPEFFNWRERMASYGRKT